MNDVDIIKALECCSKDVMLNCRNCPYEESCNMGRSDMQKDALDLINRQKAEIKEQDQAIINALHYMKEIRAEAIKEFAERLKKKDKRHTVYDEGGWDADEYAVPVGAIDNLVKETTEGTE